MVDFNVMIEWHFSKELGVCRVVTYLTWCNRYKNVVNHHIKDNYLKFFFVWWMNLKFHLFPFCTEILSWKTSCDEYTFITTYNHSFSGINTVVHLWKPPLTQLELQSHQLTRSEWVRESPSLNCDQNSVALVERMTGAVVRRIGWRRAFVLTDI